MGVLNGEIRCWRCHGVTVVRRHNVYPFSCFHCDLPFFEPETWGKMAAVTKKVETVAMEVFDEKLEAYFPKDKKTLVAAMGRGYALMLGASIIEAVLRVLGRPKLPPGYMYDEKGPYKL